MSELERLVRTSADLHLGAGEFAVPEGGERALFAVLSGKIQVIKTFDGVERTLGFRLPGTVFGEVPMAFGTPFPGGYRAIEPSRVMRVEPQQYYAIASAAPEVAMKLGKLASERIAGLQNITAEVPKTQVTMFGPRFDPACGEMRRFLARNQISHVWTTSESPEIASLGEQNCPPHAEWPVLRLVELVTSLLTSDETSARAQSFAADALGKRVIRSQDRAGFVVNALLFPYLNNAVRMWEMGTASMESIDTAMKGGCNFPMGPFALLDLVGLDTSLAILDALYAEFRDPNYAAVPTLRRMVAAGQLGRKSGKGFFDY